jgi:hypothetical protein
MSDSNYDGVKRARSTSNKETCAIEADVQQILDELWREKLIPFALNVGKISEDSGEYTIHFYDSRVRTASVTLTEGQLFRDLVREAVLARVALMSSPLRK